jgi:hypothetical protein
MKALSILLGATAAIIGLQTTTIAHATPGDIGCSKTINGRKIEVLVGIDFFDADPTFLTVSSNGTQVAEFRSVKSSRVVVMKEADGIPSFTNGQISAVGSDGLAYMVIPEQGNRATALLTLDIPSANLSLHREEMECQF